ncbi:Adhesin Ata autotransporter [Burkholderia sp. AD24]|nr:Adhesin Ata autotransporter [Burkholderia sp. AD24]
MNRTYRNVWNAVTQTWTAASEMAKGRSKGSKGLTSAAGGEVRGKKSRNQLVIAGLVGVIGLVCSMTAEAGTVIGWGGNSGGCGNAIDGSGVYSTVVGCNNANGHNKLAVTIAGSYAETADDYATALGFNSFAGAYGATAVGTNAYVSGNNSVALGAGSVADQADTVSIGRAATDPRVSPSSSTYDASGAYTRRLTNMSKGVDGTDAVNVQQLQDAGLKTDASGNATNAFVAYDSTTKDKATLGGATGTTMTNVKAGALTAASTDAVNGSQLFATNNRVAAGEAAITGLDTRVTQNESNISTLNTNVSNLDGRVTNVEGSVTNLTQQLNAGTAGLVQQNAATGNITVAQGLNGSTVDFAGTAGARVLAGVAAGAVNTSSADAVNGAQLYGVSASVAGAMGGGSTVNADGSISAPSYVVDGQTVHNAGDAISSLNTQISNINTQISTGGIGIVQQNASSGIITVGAGTAGRVVDFSGAQGPRVLTGVADGAVNSTSADAVNGSQLFAMQDNLQQQITGITSQMINIDGRVANIEINGASNGIASGIDSTATGSGSIASGDSSTATGANSTASGTNSTATGADSIASGNNSSAMGHHSRATGDNSVAIGADSVADRDNSVSMGSAGQERQVTNVAAGTAATDAVNLGQMNDAVKSAVGNLPAGMSAKQYTDQQINTVQHSVNEVAKNAYAGVAAAMAMPNMTPSAPGKTIVAAGAGSYKSGAALGVGVTYRSRNSKWLVNGAVSATSTGDTGVRAQVGYEF